MFIKLTVHKDSAVNVLSAGGRSGARYYTYEDEAHPLFMTLMGVLFVSMQASISCGRV
jgi:hypothetical protein